MIGGVFDFYLGPELWWATLIKGALIVLVLATGFAYMTYAERKVAARIQLRYGPNRVGPFGLLQPLADGIKLVFKENVAPAGRDHLLYMAGPILAAGAAVLAFAAIPLSGLSCWGGQANAGNTACLSGYALHWDIIHVNVGLLLILGITSLGVYALFLGGWSANSKYSLLGGLRSSAQLISYEMAVAFALMGAVILAGSLNPEDIVSAQRHLWFVVLQPLAFILYFVAALAETNRLPFDLPEAETELVAGYHTEYSAMRFGAYFLGEYVNMIIVCSIATLLFLGGWLPIWPFPSEWWTTIGGAIGAVFFLVKVVILLMIMLWVRWTLPRFRYDRLMGLGWKVMLPLGLLNIAITGTIVALRAG